jgi:hypothetical protein
MAASQSSTAACKSGIVASPFCVFTDGGPTEKPSAADDPAAEVGGNALALTLGQTQHLGCLLRGNQFVFQLSDTACHSMS